MITDKNADGTEIDQATTAVSIDGFTRSVGTDMDSDLLADRINSYVWVRNCNAIGRAANDNQQQFALQMASWMQSAWLEFEFVAKLITIRMMA